MFHIDPTVAALMGAQEAARYRRLQESSNAAEWKAYAEQLQDRLASAEAKLAGVTAIVMELKKLHPNSPLFQRTEIVYKRGEYAGQQKSRSTLIWEQAYDAKAKELGIADPASRRDD